MPTKLTEMITVEIPASFMWAWEHYQKWWQEGRTGQFIYDFQDGGIKNIRENICRKPKNKKFT